MSEYQSNAEPDTPHTFEVTRRARIRDYRITLDKLLSKPPVYA
jgi:hypothetical protein